MMNAVRNCIIDIEVVQLLIDRGADLTVTETWPDSRELGLIDLAFCADEREGNKEKAMDILANAGAKSTLKW